MFTNNTKIIFRLHVINIQINNANPGICWSYNLNDNWNLDRYGAVDKLLRLCDFVRVWQLYNDCVFLRREDRIYPGTAARSVKYSLIHMFSSLENMKLASSLCALSTARLSQVCKLTAHQPTLSRGNELFVSNMTFLWTCITTLINRL